MGHPVSLVVATFPRGLGFSLPYDLCSGTHGSPITYYFKAFCFLGDSSLPISRKFIVLVIKMLNGTLFLLYSYFNTHPKKMFSNFACDA